jgi:hypothetical protein
MGYSDTHGILLFSRTFSRGITKTVSNSRNFHLPFLSLTLSDTCVATTVTVRWLVIYPEGGANQTMEPWAWFSFNPPSTSQVFQTFWTPTKINDFLAQCHLLSKAKIILFCNDIYTYTNDNVLIFRFHEGYIFTSKTYFMEQRLSCSAQRMEGGLSSYNVGFVVIVFFLAHFTAIQAAKLLKNSSW